MLITLLLSGMGSGLFVFLGVFIEVLGKEYGLAFGSWKMFMYVCAAVFAAAGVLDFIITIIRYISRRKDKENTWRSKAGKYPIPKRRRRKGKSNKIF